MRPIGAGVPQGSTLSPLLYSANVNDIPRPSTGVQLAFFADDTALYLRSNCIGNILPRLQRAIDELTQWLRLWRIDVNPDKKAADAPWYVKNSVFHRHIELQTISKFMKDASECFFDIANSHPNSFLVSAVSYEPPPPHHFCRRPRNILIDPPNNLTVEVEKLIEVNKMANE
ncbi:Probable RNA-directed DNA polymerase from transposon BS [Eumeta japonica]|uniref:Probable RNA-directed DNA polymerase from transposon BS n=1 Tax=Eumeta variegata TaxID=151549 RepID=A0A4C1WUG6_EUMVA|nr:Probable RNA-directed DNA polymerase from transposon BS [Eumeta japonica]